MKFSITPLLLVFVISSYFAKAQNVVNYNFNSMVIQGEASGGSLISDDIALGVGMGYDLPLINPRFEFALKFDYLWINLDYILDIDPSNISVMRGQMHHLSATGGLNVYFGNNQQLANLYKPFRPYSYLLAGLAMQMNNLDPSETFDFPMVEGTLILPMIEIGGGAKIRVNPHWSFNLGLGFRTTFSDDIDGLVGVSGSPDIMGVLRVGVSKRL